MDWTRTFDAYCERTDAAYWSEPVNAVTNLAFIVAAAVMWRRSGGLGPARYLSAVLGLIGVGSFLFHTHATAWAATLDVVPIMVFALSYIYLANRDFLGWPVRAAALGTVAFLPFSAAVGAAVSGVPFLGVSAEYWALPLMIGVYGAGLARRGRAVGRDLLVGAGILVVSLVFRSLDEPFCGAFPLGTHFLWHILNAVMLGWMIETWCREARRGFTSASVRGKARSDFPKE